jgi:Uma2 family endonuclease
VTVTEAAATVALADERWRWTVDAYDKAVELGLFGPDPHVELLDGEVFTIAPMLPGHSTAADLLDTLARRQLNPARWAIGCQAPVVLDDHTKPEPDLWVAKAARRAYIRRHPGPDDLVLVVDVADTSLAHDKNEKIPAYAGAGVPYAWLVSLPEKTITVYSEPMPAERRYQDTAVFSPGETVNHPPTCFSIDLAELL